MNAAVMLCLDRNKLVEQESGPPAKVFYEAEAIRCVRSWRENARWDGKIYAAQYRSREVSYKTKKALADLGVEIIVLPGPESRRNFMDVVQALVWAESGGVRENRVVYSDLDLYMTECVPQDFLVEGRPVLYHYAAEDQREPSAEFAYRLRRGRELGYLCHNTYFQAFDRGGGFQKAVWDAAFSPEYDLFFRKNVYYMPTDDDYFFEEGAYDFVCMRDAGKFGVLDMPCPGNFFEHRHITAETLRI